MLESNGGRDVIKEQGDERIDGVSYSQKQKVLGFFFGEI
jgi:hypothetical protein